MTSQERAGGPRIWVDADACPRVIKDLIFRAAERTKVPTILVANQHMAIPRSEHVRLVVVPSGPDEADKHIAAEVRTGDLVVTADVPLASAIVEKGALGISPRGKVWDEDNVAEALSLRDFHTGLRESGMETSGPAALKDKDKHRFASALDRSLTQLTR